ncbi:MAG: hypothetical protein AAGA54_10560 [Myxococcota bacterium]
MFTHVRTLAAVAAVGLAPACIIVTDDPTADTDDEMSSAGDAETTADDDAGAEDGADEGSSGGDEGGDGGSVDDPAPDCTEPGSCGCEGCPNSELPTDDINAGSVTSWTFAGIVNGAQGDGTFFIEGADGQTFGGLIPTDDAGAFSFTAPLFCGEQLVKCVWSNDAGQYVLVTRVITEDCIEPDIRVGLSWTELGDDFELHLVRPGGQINTEDDCTWTTCVGSSPDWGEPGDPNDDPRKDVDNTGAYGPENIVLASPEAGTYTVLVEHWSNGDPMSPGTVTFNVDGETTVVEIGALAPREVWTAGTIEWPSGTVTTSQEVFDCSESWSSGCTAPLP